MSNAERDFADDNPGAYKFFVEKGVKRHDQKGGLMCVDMNEGKCSNKFL